MRNIGYPDVGEAEVAEALDALVTGHVEFIGLADAIVIKTSEQTEDFGPSRNIIVKDCVVTSRDSGLKIGTETFGDISKVLFEHCKVVNSGRGPTITHRQPGNSDFVRAR